MSYPSNLDKIYYLNKYNIRNITNDMDLLKYHYKKGKKLGFFPNENAEKYYCKMRNFDSKFYYSKYRHLIDKSKLNSLEYWKRYGFHLNHHINACESHGYHQMNCKCAIKYECPDNKYMNKCHQIHTYHHDDKPSLYIESYELESINDLKCNKNIYPDDHIIIEDLGENIDNKFHNERSHDFDNSENLKIIYDNIQKIEEYIHQSIIHLEHIQNILKNAFQLVLDMTDIKMDQIIYDSLRHRITILMREMDRCIDGATSVGYPIFRKKNSPKYIKFPIFVSTNESLNQSYSQIFGENMRWFKLALLKLSIEELGLYNYCAMPLKSNELMSNDSNPFPSQIFSNYLDKSDGNLSIDTHIKKFENAMYNIAISIENYNTIFSILKNKRELCDKLKLMIK